MAPPFVLKIDTDAAAASPLYRQIVDGLRTALVDGVFAEGTQLPTVRELAMELGVHHNTVAEAYRVLADEGWLELGRRRGAIARRHPARRADPNGEEVLVQRLRALVAEAVTGGLSRRVVERALTRVASALKET